MMRAVVFDAPERVRIAEVPEPEVEEPGDAVIRVTRTAICGSDLHFLHAKAPLEPGAVMGHEAVGVVEEVGDAVARHRPGDRVVASFVIACGRCWFCATGRSSLCDEVRHLGAGPFGGDLGGAQAERLRVPVADVNLLAVPDGVRDESALFVGDALSTGMYAAGLASVAPGGVVAVIGAGPVGLFGALSVIDGGASVLMVEPEASRRSGVEAVGAVAVDPSERHPVSAIAEATEGRGADAVIEAVGHPDAFELAVDAVRRGGTIAIAGVYAGEQVPLQLGAAWARGLTFRFAGSTPVHAWWERAMEAVAGGRIDPTRVVSHRLPLAEAPEGYRLFASRAATKVVLVP